jgi:hypothetical protein
MAIAAVELMVVSAASTVLLEARGRAASPSAALAGSTLASTAAAVAGLMPAKVDNM